MGFSDPNDFYLSYISEVYDENVALARPLKLISIGAGNCDMEIELGKRLLEKEKKDWMFECLELNPEMIKRGKERAESEKLGDRFIFQQSDIKQWKAPKASNDIVIANHSLHHFVDLEILFDKIHHTLQPNGYFLTNDMIGRNGHMRWPEVVPAMEMVWNALDDKYKYNHQLKRLEKAFCNWDCAQSGFEGIRAQDILPLLVKKFSFQMFLGFGNLIDVFVDRCFGHNFDPESERDRNIIDMVACLDELYLEKGIFKPTHIIAAMRNRKNTQQPKIYKHFSPEYCVRKKRLFEKL